MGAGSAFVGMSAARATTLALIAKSAAPPSNKIVFRLPPKPTLHRSVAASFKYTQSFLAVTQGPQRDRNSLWVLRRCVTTVDCTGFGCPLGQSTVFQSPKKLGIANTNVRDGRACACVATNQRKD